MQTSNYMSIQATSALPKSRFIFLCALNVSLKGCNPVSTPSFLLAVESGRSASSRKFSSWQIFKRNSHLRLTKIGPGHNHKQS